MGHAVEILVIGTNVMLIHATYWVARIESREAKGHSASPSDCSKYGLATVRRLSAQYARIISF